MSRILRNLSKQQIKKSGNTVRAITKLLGGARATGHLTGILSTNLYNYSAGIYPIPPQHAATLYDHCLNIKTIKQLDELGITRENMCPDVFHKIIDKVKA